VNRNPCHGLPPLASNRLGDCLRLLHGNVNDLASLSAVVKRRHRNGQRTAWVDDWALRFDGLLAQYNQTVCWLSRQIYAGWPTAASPRPESPCLPAGRLLASLHLLRDIMDRLAALKLVVARRYPDPPAWLARWRQTFDDRLLENRAAIGLLAQQIDDYWPEPNPAQGAERD
jgi:hypothetical protein